MSEVNNEYDIGNRLVRSNDKKFSYDDDSNQIQAGDTSFDHMTSHVNGNNVERLKSVYENDDHVASYSYTLEGLRTGKYLDSGQNEISYHYSGKNVIYEKWSDGRTVRYTHQSTGSSSCSSCGGCGNEKNVFTDHPISIEIDGTKYYYLYDGQGSVTELINSDEEVVVNQYRYTPFGSPRLKAETVYNPYQYTGRRLDEETGQYYYRARMYWADQSRFTTQDPAGMQEGPNMYAYVGNIIGTTVPMSVGNPADFLLNPVNKRDPSGLSPGDAIIDGGGSGGDGDTCPDTTWYLSWDQCMNERDDVDECADMCFSDNDDDGGDSGDISLPPKAECVLNELGISVMTNPILYAVCTVALGACIVGGVVTGGSSLLVCIAAKGAITACTVAGAQIGLAAAQCGLE